jgi:hypothetical protein
MRCPKSFVYPPGLLRIVIDRRARRARGRSAESRSRASAETRAARSAKTRPGTPAETRAARSAKTGPTAGTKSRAGTTSHAGTGARTTAVDSAAACNGRILVGIVDKFPLVVVGLFLVDLDRRFLVHQSNSNDRSSTDAYARGSEGATAAPGRLHSAYIVGRSTSAGCRRPVSPCR